MSALSEIISLTITANSLGINLPGFGIPLVVSHNAQAIFGATQRLRYYQSTAGVLSDGFSASSPEYLAAQALFGQSPAPTQIAIGSALLKPTLQYTIDAGAPGAQNSHVYSINASGQGVTAGTATYTSTATADVAHIHYNLVNALNAIVGANYTAAFVSLTGFTPETFTVANQAQGQVTATAHGLNTGDGPFQLTTTGSLPTGLSTLTNYWVIRVDANTLQFATSLANAMAGTFIVLSSNGTPTNTINNNAALSPAKPFTVTGTAAGNWFALEVVNPGVDLKTSQTHADPGIATDLAAILNYQANWYGIVTLYNSKALVQAAAAWTEANGKLYIPDVAESDAIQTTTGNGDTLDALFSSKYNRTGGVYHPRPAEFLSAAWLGRMLPITPGGDDWKFKQLAGPTADIMSATQRTNLRARNANFYYPISNVTIMTEGTVAGGTYAYIDVTRSLDWVANDMSVAIANALINANKTPLTDAGIATIENEVRGSLKRATANGIFDPGTTPTITVPTVASLSSAQRAARQLPNVQWSARMAGAIHSVVINGVVTF